MMNTGKIYFLLILLVTLRIDDIRKPLVPLPLRQPVNHIDFFLNYLTRDWSRGHIPEKGASGSLHACCISGI